ncbi:MAG: helix-turn-helix transcriptional regulator [Oscillospiraceae bacterium]|nr:helix-turn-helix transcriptional regulator [Oscillospiraceae bacterium]
MSNLYITLTGLCEKRRITLYRMCRDTGIQPSVMTDLKMGRRRTVKAETAAKLADYFGVTVHDLLGAQAAPLPPELLKFELFGGEATDQQLEEVRQFAKFVKERDACRP